MQNININRPPEDDFILNSARVNLSESNIDCLNRLVREGLNWNILESKAYAHSVSNIIFYSLKNHGLSALVPEDVFNRFREKYYETGVSNSVVLRSIDKLSEVIGEKFVLLKGSDLISSLYPSLAIRSMCDIDILVERKHSKDIWKKLLADGFNTLEVNLHPPKSSLHNRYSEGMNRHLPQVYTDVFKTELHWNLFSGAHQHPVTEVAFGSSVQIKDNVYRLSVEMKLIHLSNHFSYHLKRNAVLRMLCDINEIILKHGNEIDWTELRNTISGTELKIDVSTAFTYAYAMFRTPVPEDYLDKEILNEYNFELGHSLIKPGKEITHQDIYISRLKSFNKYSEKIVFVFRTFFPSAKWVNAKFNTKTVLGLGLSYFKYWNYLFVRHVLKKEIVIGT